MGGPRKLETWWEWGLDELTSRTFQLSLPHGPSPPALPKSY
jgi:hypothetical protein